VLGNKYSAGALVEGFLSYRADAAVLERRVL
jgi:hypothetical protein